MTGDPAGDAGLLPSFSTERWVGVAAAALTVIVGVAIAATNEPRDTASTHSSLSDSFAASIAEVDALGRAETMCDEEPEDVGLLEEELQWSCQATLSARGEDNRLAYEITIGGDDCWAGERGPTTEGDRIVLRVAPKKLTGCLEG